MPGEAMKLVKETSTVKYDATVDVALFLGVDPKESRSSYSLHCKSATRNW